MRPGRKTEVLKEGKSRTRTRESKNTKMEYDRRAARESKQRLIAVTVM
jgi:hypothetical protein